MAKAQFKRLDKILLIRYSMQVYIGVAMERQKRWHLFLILAVIGLTIYNIFPTVFYYCRPLKQPISTSTGKEIAQKVADRIADLEKESLDWVRSFCHLLQIKPVSIGFEGEGKECIAVRLSKGEDAARLRRYLPRAGSSISFAPARLSLIEAGANEDSKTIFIKRALSVGADESAFVFAEKGSDLYRKVILERASAIGSILAGPSETAL